MICLLADNIISPLGFTSEENFLAVKSGRRGMRLHEGVFGVPEPFMAAIFDRGELDRRFVARFPDTTMRCTALEKAALLSAYDAVARAGIDAGSPRVRFVLSSTKGNVHLLDGGEGYEPERIYLWRSAEIIAGHFGNPNPPLVVSNACISGASALIAAAQDIRAGRCDYAVVTGVDMLSKFIVSGFQSFKALSEEPCRPFDAGRTGLNLGEAAATIVLGRKIPGETSDSDVILTSWAVRNDANHISGPSRTGEGSYLALCRVLDGVPASEVAFINAHGTATPYNDEMESIAITRAGLGGVPTGSLKGYFGHTLGAAGVLESIISARALGEGFAPGTAGYTSCGISHPLNVEAGHIAVTGRHFVKMLSGFGGCNAAMLFTKGEERI